MAIQIIRTNLYPCNLESEPRKSVVGGDTSGCVGVCPRFFIH